MATATQSGMTSGTLHERDHFLRDRRRDDEARRSQTGATKRDGTQGGPRSLAQGEEVMIQDDGLWGVDDLIAEHAFAQRALRRYKAAAPDSRCSRRLRHPREPT